MRTNIRGAQFAVVGAHPDLGAGVLFWHDNELDAHREAKEIRKTLGASAKVYPTPGGDMSYLQEHILDLIFEK
jgi:hypothetical protein